MNAANATVMPGMIGISVDLALLELLEPVKDDVNLSPVGFRIGSQQQEPLTVWRNFEAQAIRFEQHSGRSQTERRP